MRGTLTISALLLSIFGALLALAPAAAADPAVAGEFPMPPGSTVGSNNEIVAGPDGNMWVTTDAPAGVARFTPDGTATLFPLTNPAFGITLGPDGNLWASQQNGVAKISPTGTPTETAVPGLGDGRGITVGPDGNIWIIGTNALARINPANPVEQDVNVVPATNARGLATASDGLLWYAAGDTVMSATAADTPTLTPYTVGGGTQDVAAGPSGQVLYVNPGGNPQTVGRLAPGGEPQLTDVGPTDPFGAVFAPDGAYWIARSNANDLLRVTPEGAASNLTGFAPSGGVGPRKVATGPGNTLWVTLDTPEKVAKVTGVEPPPIDPGTPGDLDTAIDKGPKSKVKAKGDRAKVKFEFSAAVADASFECALTKKRKGKKAKPPIFRECKSPKTYRLEPGRYSFSVRALLGGVVDPSPATLRFKVKKSN